MPCTGRKGKAAIGSRDRMRTLIVAAGVIIEQEKVLVTQRMENSPHGLLWEFPGGKLKEGEEPREALRRELKEELGFEAEVGRIIEPVFHLFPDPLLLLTYQCYREKGRLERLGCRDFRWVDLGELAGLAMPPADGPVRHHLSVFAEDYGMTRR